MNEMILSKSWSKQLKGLRNVNSELEKIDIRLDAQVKVKVASVMCDSL